MFKNYFKSAWRNLMKNKVFSFINIAGLSIGIAVSFVILMYVQDELFCRQSYCYHHRCVTHFNALFFIHL
ncbi:MAG: ABC transporter permease [Ilyomonas sp.]